jgi:hypothetical protein
MDLVMASSFNLVVPKVDAPSPLSFHQALVAGLARVAVKTGRGNLADKSQRTTKALDKLFSGDSMDTSGKGLLDFLLADPTALDEVLALYGYQLARKGSVPSEDMALASDTAALVQEHMDGIRDGTTGQHQKIIRIADKARPVIAGYAGFVAQADRIRGLAA